MRQIGHGKTWQDTPTPLLLLAKLGYVLPMFSLAGFMLSLYIQKKIMRLGMMQSMNGRNQPILKNFTS